MLQHNLKYIYLKASPIDFNETHFQVMKLWMKTSGKQKYDFQGTWLKVRGALFSEINHTGVLTHVLKTGMNWILYVGIANCCQIHFISWLVMNN